uniref:Uncharacterized protein n=1 Tax=Arundo donax TaxID=35708 RepID=A0A0A9A147_ARUDO
MVLIKSLYVNHDHDMLVMEPYQTHMAYIFPFRLTRQKDMHHVL